MNAVRRDVLHDPMLGTSAVFRPLQRGRRRKLDVTAQSGDIEVRWRGPDELGVGDQSVLFAVLEAARDTMVAQHAGALVDADDPLWQRLEHQDFVFRASTVRVTTTFSGLAQRCDWGDGGTAIALVRESLRRLTETTVWVRRGSSMGSSRLLAWHVGDDRRVTLAVNWRLAAALQGESYSRVSAAERAQLRDEPGKALHALLSCRLRRGQSWRCGLDKLQEHVWGDVVEGANLRGRRAKLRRALRAIGELPAWTVEVDARGIAQVQRLGGASPTQCTAAAQRSSVVSSTRRPKADEPPSHRCPSERCESSTDAGFVPVDASVLF
jgi:hypothetical protein